MSTPATPGTPQNPLDEHADEFNQLGRLFCVLNEIWVRKFHLRQPYPEGLRQIGPWHSERYRSDQSKRDGVVAELYKFVPLHFHQYLEGSHFFAKKVPVHHLSKCTRANLIYSSSLLEPSQ